MFVLFFPVSTNTVRVLWRLTVLRIVIMVPVLFACLLWYLRALVMEQTLHAGAQHKKKISSQCFCRNNQDTLTSLKNQQKGKERVPPAPGHSLLLKTISIAELSNFYQTNSPHRSMTAMNWDCRRHMPYSVLLLQHHRCRDKHRDRTGFWVDFGREGWELTCEIECKLATHLLSKNKGKMSIGTSAQKKLDVLAEDA